MTRVRLLAAAVALGLPLLAMPASADRPHHTARVATAFYEVDGSHRPHRRRMHAVREPDARFAQHRRATRKG